MALVIGDWKVDRATGNIRYTGYDHDGTTSLPDTTGGARAPSYATVLELHRYLQDLADEAISSGDDQLDITDVNPSLRATDNLVTLVNGYNIDDVASEHLYDGTIIQNGGDDRYDGIVNFGNAGVKIQIIQNGAVLADDWWNANGGLNPLASNGISHQFMLKVRSGGADIDGRRLIGISREWGTPYAEFLINGSSPGVNVLALSAPAGGDLNNATAVGTVATYDRIVNSSEGYVELDIDLNGTPESYYSQWDIVAGTTPANPTINDVYEYAKWLTRDGSTETLYGLNGELFRGITHQITYTTLAGGTFADSLSVTFGNGATAQILADNGTDTMWVQLLTGVAPVNSDSITQGGVTASVNVVTGRAISLPFIGQSTGSSIIGAKGIGFDPADLTASDQIFQLSEAQVFVPNNVSVTVNGLVSGEDRVLVAPWDGTTLDAEGFPAIQVDQLTLSGDLTTDNVTSVTVSTAIPDDTPVSGYIRVQDNNGFYRRLHYASYSGSTFTIDSTDGQEDFAAVNATGAKNVWIAYIDELASGTSASFTTVYSSDRDLVVKVRDGGASPIKEFITSSAIKGTNQSVTAIRTADA